MNTRQILERLISFDTTSRNPNLELINYISELLNTVGIASEIIKSNCGKKANLFASTGPQKLGGVMLSGHTDVVPVDGQNWTRPPFELTREGQRLFGRGTTDMKGFVASSVSLMLKAARRDLNTPLHLAFSYDEEIGCVGVHSLLDMLAQAPVRPHMCIVGEPTNMAVATGHKGKTGLNAVCHGVEGHSALAPLAFNALHLGADLVNVLRDIQMKLETNGARDADYDVPFSTVHAGKFNGGVALNIVPNRCDIAFEIRNVVDDDPHAILEDIKSRCDEIVEQAQKHSPQANIEIEIFNTYPGLDTPTNSDVVSFVKSLTGANGTIKVAFGTEGGLFSQKLGIPTVVCGPGSMAQGHKPDEYIEVEQLSRCDEMLSNLLGRLEAGL